MTDIITQTFTADVMVILSILIISTLIAGVIFSWRKKFYAQYFIFNTFAMLTVFAEFSVINLSYMFMLMIMTAAGITYVFRKIFLSTEFQGTNESIMSSYIVFFISIMFMQSITLMDYLNFVSIDAKAITCNAGLIGEGYLSCAYQYLQTFFALFQTNFHANTALIIFDTILGIPFLAFVFMYIVRLIRG